MINKRYLQLYPHLLTEEDVDYDNPGLSCGFHDDETRTPGHHMLNLGANYRRNTRYGEWNWYVKADNLLNQSVYAHSSFLSDTPQMGRSFTGGVNVKF